MTPVWKRPIRGQHTFRSCDYSRPIRIQYLKSRYHPQSMRGLMLCQFWPIRGLEVLTYDPGVKDSRRDQGKSLDKDQNTVSSWRYSTLWDVKEGILLSFKTEHDVLYNLCPLNVYKTQHDPFYHPIDVFTTEILASDWSRVITWHRRWPLIRRDIV